MVQYREVFSEQNKSKLASSIDFLSLHRSQTSSYLLSMEDQEMQLKVKRVTDKFTESMYVLANEPSVALYRLQEHVRRSLPELVQHKTDMQSWEEQSQGAIYTVEYACSAVKSMTNSSLYFKSIEGLLRQTISMKDHISATQGRRKRAVEGTGLKEGGERHGSGV
ncbi:BLOC-1-related complex subunit 8 isoform X2 [Anguilla anguilla]|uniref:BLOC-1-related complex subunit 8 isoform X2 n=2 Tax=Anguilla TaxID=7935 RepID=UPI0015A9D239|nr:BLOC-1-related complex subunit 8 isoform X2 [Anguilla anguilla]